MKISTERVKGYIGMKMTPSSISSNYHEVIYYIGSYKSRYWLDASLFHVYFYANLNREDKNDKLPVHAIKYIYIYTLNISTYIYTEYINYWQVR